MTDVGPVAQAVTINMTVLRNIGVRGVNRAAGFLGLAFRRPDQPLPETVTMSAFNTYQFLPEPLPPELAGELVAEFNAWLVGNALQELDRHFSLFVDEIWRLLDLTDAHNQVVPAGFKVSDIGKDTNAAKKYEKVAERLAMQNPRADRLWSISNGRNCLAHAAGRVTERHTNDDQRLKLVWLAMEARLQQGEHYVVMDRPVLAPDPNQEALVVLAAVDRERFFDIGAAIVLTPLDLHELCLYYSIVIDTMMAALGEHFAVKGIPNVPALG